MIGGVDMKPSAIRRWSEDENMIIAASEPQVPVFGPIDYCAVCRLVFATHESRVLEGDKVAHVRCARRLDKPRAA